MSSSFVSTGSQRNRLNELRSKGWNGLANDQDAAELLKLEWDIKGRATKLYDKKDRDKAVRYWQRNGRLQRSQRRTNNLLIGGVLLMFVLPIVLSERLMAWLEDIAENGPVVILEIILIALVVGLIVSTLALVIEKIRSIFRS